MLYLCIFKHTQELCYHIFRLNACANNPGNNALCTQYCAPKGSFLSKDLQAEFIWLNPPFKRANDSLEAYFGQKREYPDHVRVCVLLPCWRHFADILELRRLSLLKHYASGTLLFSQPDRIQKRGRRWLECHRE